MKAAISPTTLLLALSMLSMTVGCRAPGRAQDGVGNPDANDTVQILMQDMIEVRGQQGIYTYGDLGAKTEIAFPLPADRINVAYFHDVERVGKTDSGIVAVLDTYGSAQSAGARCTDGREAWLRLFSIAGKRQLRAIPVESCLDRLTPGKPPVMWRGNSFETGGSPRQRFTIEGDTIRQVTGEQQ